MNSPIPENYHQAGLLLLLVHCLPIKAENKLSREVLVI